MINLKLSFNKRGNAIGDGAMVLVVLFIFSLTAFTAYRAFTDINTDVQASSDLSAKSKNMSSGLLSRFSDTFDSLFALVLVGLWGAVLIASYHIDTRPIFFIFTFILLVFLLIASISIANYYEDFTTDSDFSALAADFPIMNFVMSHLLAVMISIGFSIMLVMFGKVYI